jgi:ankyrin repeat protein
MEGSSACKSDLILPLPQANHQAGMSCLSFLAHSILGNDGEVSALGGETPCHEDYALRHSDTKKFKKYSILHWPDHLAMSQDFFRAAVRYAIEVLYECGARLVRRLSNQQTALLLAARSGRLLAVRYLVSAGLDVNLVDSFGRSALLEASS